VLWLIFDIFCANSGFDSVGSAANEATDYTIHRPDKTLSIYAAF